MGLEAFAAAFGLIFISEIADKTQILIIGLSAKYQSRLQVYAGALAALALSDGIAIAAGSLVYSIITPLLLKLFIGGLFIVLGFYMLLNDEGGKVKEAQGRRTILAAFMAVFLSEIGDKSQVAAGALGAKYGDFPLVFLGTMAALAAITVISIFIGSRIAGWKHAGKVGRISAAVFIAVGIATLLS